MEPTASERDAHTRSTSPWKEGGSGPGRSRRDDRERSNFDTRDRSRSPRPRSLSRSRSRSPWRDRRIDRSPHRHRSPIRHRSPRRDHYSPRRGHYSPRRHRSPHRDRSPGRYYEREKPTMEKEWDRQKERDGVRGMERRRDESSAQTRGLDFGEFRLKERQKYFDNPGTSVWERSPSPPKAWLREERKDRQHGSRTDDAESDHNDDDDDDVYGGEGAQEEVENEEGSGQKRGRKERKEERRRGKEEKRRKKMDEKKHSKRHKKEKHKHKHTKSKHRDDEKKEKSDHRGKHSEERHQDEKSNGTALFGTDDDVEERKRVRFMEDEAREKFRSLHHFDGDSGVVENEDMDDVYAGPMLPSSKDDGGEEGKDAVNEDEQAFLPDFLKTYGRALLPGEGEAIAQYVKKGKRIPRRGEVGHTSAEIEGFEAAGFVMSGSRNKRMEAIRMRKENQVIGQEMNAAQQYIDYEQKERRNAIVSERFRSILEAAGEKAARFKRRMDAQKK